MRATVCVFLSMVIAVSVRSQDEFAANGFYKDLKKIEADAQAGFIQYKGAREKSQDLVHAEEFKVKLMLPLADSGKIVIPERGRPYAEYYFQPARKRDQINSRASSLRFAIANAYGKQLFTRSETFEAQNKSFNNTWFYTDLSLINTGEAIFRSTVVYQEKNHLLILRIMGKPSGLAP